QLAECPLVVALKEEPPGIPEDVRLQEKHPRDREVGALHGGQRAKGKGQRAKGKALRAKGSAASCPFSFALCPLRFALCPSFMVAPRAGFGCPTRHCAARRGPAGRRGGAA